MALALAIVGLINAAVPGIASLIVLIKKQDGSVSVLTTISEADANFNADIAAVNAWLAVNPTPKV